MSAEEMKKDINDKINEHDESQLKMLEKFIEKMNFPKGDEWDLKNNVPKIVEERAEVLKKLAL